jgi:hypothetical protein
LFDDDTFRRFCEALHKASAGRPAPWWTSIVEVARRMGLDVDCATALADECAIAGYVQHDQSQSTKAARRRNELPHSVTLMPGGRALLERPRNRRGR